MPADRYESPEENLARLLQRRRYAQAIGILRTRLAQRRPDPRTRLRLADLLVAAGRGAEAVPVLLALSEELAASGELSKAVAALKRVERLDPQRGDVGPRLQRLVAERHRLLALASRAPQRAPTEAPVDEPLTPPADAGLSEAPKGPPEDQEPSADEPADPKLALRFRGLLGRLMGSADEPPVAATEEAARAEAGGPGGASSSGPDVVPLTRPAEAAGSSAPGVPPPEAGPATSPRPAEERVAERRSGLRGLLGRLFGRGGETEAPESTVPAVPPAPPEGAGAGPAGEPVQRGATAAVEPPQGQGPPGDTRAVDVEPAPETPPDAPASPSAARSPGPERDDPEPLAPSPAADSHEEQPPAPAPAPGDTQVEATVGTPPSPAADEVAAASVSAPEAPAPPGMSEDDFHERLLDVVEEMLRREEPGDSSAAGAIAPRQLLTSPLLAELGEQELEQLVQRLKLLTCEPGDVLLTEGEAGETLFLLVGGTVKVFVRNPEQRNVAVLELRGGDFFGEISVLSGRPRSATITAATPCELLEIDRATLDELTRSHPGMVDTLEAYFLARTQSAAAATLRDAVLGPEARRRAEAVLRSHFGAGGFDPRTQLKLADALLRSGQREDALALLASLADDLARHGYPEKAVAILKKIERLQGRGVEEIALAPLRRRDDATPAPAPAAAGREQEFHGWLVDLVRDSVERGGARRSPTTAPGLLMSPLFADFSEDELLSLVRSLRLLSLDAGDVVVSEGEAGNSVFVLTSGSVKIFVRDPHGRNVLVGRLGEGEFFGEISLLSGRPRSATVTAAAACELLELDREAFDDVCARHPRVRAVMEEVYIQRASHPLAARVRAAGQEP